MSSIINPGRGVLYMKVGTHANEPLEAIIARKTKEIEDEGVAFWGYGGSSCNPGTIVQPFGRSFEQRGEVIYLVMQPIDSRHFAETVRAEEFSIDGINWKPIPPGINVTGSRYAVVIKNLRKEEFDLPLDRTKVALGNSTGATGSKYIRGHVDKACLEIIGESSAEGEHTQPVRIGLVAQIVQPYAVHVRNLIR